MRNAFTDEIEKLANEDDRVYLLSGDIGNLLFDSYKERFADRFMNCGVAEANMMGVAAGMAASGLRPFVYTITPFTTSRCYEQIKVDVCYHHVPVVIVGVGAGLSYASLGPTHHSFEDIAILRVLPGISIVCPADPWEVRAALRACLEHDGPVYLRLGKQGEPLIHDNVPDFRIGKAIIVREGTDVCILGTGNILSAALETAESLEKRGISACVVSFHTVKPLDEDILSRAFSDFKQVVTIEEHSIVGGLGSAVAEWTIDNGPYKAHLLRFGMRDKFMCEVGNQQQARAYFGISPETIMEYILKRYKQY